jgi:hypothetical protein
MLDLSEKNIKNKIMDKLNKITLSYLCCLLICNTSFAAFPDQPYPFDVERPGRKPFTLITPTLDARKAEAERAEAEAKKARMAKKAEAKRARKAQAERDAWRDAIEKANDELRTELNARRADS